MFIVIDGRFKVCPTTEHFYASGEGRIYSFSTQDQAEDLRDHARQRFIDGRGVTVQFTGSDHAYETVVDSVYYRQESDCVDIDLRLA